MTKEKKDAEAAAGKPATQTTPPAGNDKPKDDSRADAQKAAEAEAAREEAERKKAEAEQAQKTDSIETLVKRYAKCYPKCKEFHVTTDRQVFLSGDKNLAILHQSMLQDEGKVRTVKVK